jgi:hypothetical protein
MIKLIPIQIILREATPHQVLKKDNSNDSSNDYKSNQWKKNNERPKFNNNNYKQEFIQLQEKLIWTSLT